MNAKDLATLVMEPAPSLAEVLAEAEAMPYLMADIRVTGHPDAERVFAVYQALERAARCLAAGAYVDPNPKLREAGVCAIRVGTVAFRDLLHALQCLQGMAPMVIPELGLSKPEKSGEPF